MGNLTFRFFRGQSAQIELFDDVRLVSLVTRADFRRDSLAAIFSIAILSFANVQRKTDKTSLLSRPWIFVNR